MPKQFAAKTRVGQATQFAYPDPMKPVEKVAKVKVASAVLSTNKSRRTISAVATPIATSLLPDLPRANKDDGNSIAATAG